MKKNVPTTSVEFARGVYAYHEAPICHLKLPIKVAEYYRGFPERAVEQPMLVDVRKHGILTPLQIYTNGHVGYLGDGHRRLNVAQKLGLTELPIQIMPDMIRWSPPLGVHDLEPVLYSWVLHHPWHAGHHQERIAIKKAYLMRCDCGSYWRQEK
jgi:hypothetical protein